MSRTYKDMKAKKEVRKRKTKELLKARYRNFKQSGFPEDLLFANAQCTLREVICPECGIEMTYDRGYIFCDRCHWGSIFPDDKNMELKFSDAA